METLKKIILVSASIWFMALVLIPTIDVMLAQFPLIFGLFMNKFIDTFYKDFDDNDSSRKNS